MVGSNDELAPISWASTIIGFVSFAFTVSTFVRVILGNLRTLGAAPGEVPFYLANLKQELFEERLHLRRARRRAERYMRHCRRDGRGIPSWDSAPTLRLIDGTVRQLCKEFKELERPFLIDRRDRGLTGGGGAEKGDGFGEKEWDDYMEGGFEQDYGTVTLYHRFAWLKRKAAVQSLALSLERLQIRRIGRESTDALVEIKNLKAGLQELRLIPGGEDGGSGGGPTRGGGGGGGGGGNGGTRRRRSSQKRGRREEVSYSDSESSESSRSDLEKEKVEKVHVRRASRYRR